MTQPNEYTPHLYVLPEDEETQEIANGFESGISEANSRRIKVLPYAKGWEDVVRQFGRNYVHRMRRNENIRMVLLIDFDVQDTCVETVDRLAKVKRDIPDDLKNRVFVLGVLDEPERLERETKMTAEQIGLELAKNCAENELGLWGHDLLRHNKCELNRMAESVKPFLFADA